MTPDRYERVREVFLAVRARAADDRANALHQLCLCDAELRSQVEALLLREGPSDGFLKSPALGANIAAAGATAWAGPAAIASGAHPERIGRYRIVQLIGEGGMGTVYEAEQDQPRRTVALKCIKPGLSSAAALRRFELEADLLGRLQHPGIAHVYEAGMADAGLGVQPYFAMELIAGRTLLRFVQEQRLAIPRRLELAARVADAVQHAHLKGIIHRDLKPGNILVTDEGQPKILDFGVARATDVDMQTTTLQTDVGQLIGTIPYMSPEQVGGDPRQLDTRSDIYALGVVIFELLTGRLPYAIQDRSIPDAIRTIREDEPSRAGSVNRSLRGDIETIVGKALEKDRERRYQTAAALAADIRRYLNNEPLAARPPSAMYQLGKFARRNKALVGGVAAVFIVLAAGLATTTAMYLRAVGAEKEQTRLALLAEDRRVSAEESARQATVAAEESRLASERAKKAAEFLSGMVGLGDPWGESSRPNMTIVEAAEVAARQLDAGYWGHDHVMEAMLRDQLGNVHAASGRFAEAERYFREAVRLSAAPTERVENRIAYRSNLASLLTQRGRLAEAEELAREAVELPGQPTTTEADGVARAQALLMLGRIHRQQGRFEEAESDLDQALETLGAAASSDADHAVALLAALDSRANLYKDLGRLAEAERDTERSLAIARKALPPRHIRTAHVLSNLSTLYFSQGRFAEAEPLNREAYEAARVSLGERHPNTIGVLKNLGTVLVGLGRLDEAEPILTRTLALQREVVGPTSPLVASHLFSLGVLYHGAGRHAEAERSYREAIEVGLAALGPEHPTVGDFTHNLAVLLMTTGRINEAEPHAREALRLRAKGYPPEHNKPAQSRSVLGGILIELGRHDEAEPLLLEAFAVLDDAQGVPPSFRAECIKRLVTLYEARHKPEEAARWRASEAADQPKSP